MDVKTIRFWKVARRAGTYVWPVTDVGHAGKLVVWVNIEDIFDGQGSIEDVSFGRMYDTFGFPSF